MSCITPSGVVSVQVPPSNAQTVGEESEPRTAWYFTFSPSTRVPPATGVTPSARYVVRVIDPPVEKQLTGSRSAFTFVVIERKVKIIADKTVPTEIIFF
jgi:hypothetical protein